MQALLDHLILAVNDLDESMRFYTEVLGFQPSQDIPVGEYRWISAALDGRPGSLASTLRCTGRKTIPVIAAQKIG